jgi:TIR domain
VATIFISYRTGDEESGAALIDTILSTRFGAEQVFRAPKSIPPGAEFERGILGAVRRSEVFLAVIGPRWADARDRAGRRRLDNAGDWVRREIVTAFQCGVRVIPLLLNGAGKPEAETLPRELSALARCQYLRVHYRNIEYDVGRLADELLALVPRLGMNPSRQAPADPSVPAANVNNGIMATGMASLNAEVMAAGPGARAVHYGRTFDEDYPWFDADTPG